MDKYCQTFFYKNIFCPANILPVTRLLVKLSATYQVISYFKVTILPKRNITMPSYSKSKKSSRDNQRSVSSFYTFLTVLCYIYLCVHV